MVRTPKDSALAFARLIAEAKTPAHAATIVG
jgi:hypothetical protein